MEQGVLKRQLFRWGDEGALGEICLSGLVVLQEVKQVIRISCKAL